MIEKTVRGYVLSREEALRRARPVQFFQARQGARRELMGRAVRLLVTAAVVAGCGVFAPQPVDLAPGQRVVLGRIDLSGLEVTEGIVDIVRQGGGFGRELRVGQGATEFAVGLPAGRYWIARLRGAKDGRTLSDQFIRDLNVGFEVGDAPAVYIGTLRVTGGFGRGVRVTVVDEMEETLGVLRTRYSDLPPTPARALMTPG